MGTLLLKCILMPRVVLKKKQLMSPVVLITNRSAHPTRLTSVTMMGLVHGTGELPSITVAVAPQKNQRLRTHVGQDCVTHKFYLPLKMVLRSVALFEILYSLTMSRRIIV